MKKHSFIFSTLLAVLLSLSLISCDSGGSSESDTGSSTTFGTDNIVRYLSTNDSQGNCIKFDSDGNIIIAGEINNGSNTDVAIWKYDKNGNPVTSFGTDGVVIYDGGYGDTTSSMAIDSSGNIYLTGIIKNSSSYKMAVWKYDSSGSLVTSFATDGIYTSSDDQDDGKSIALDSEGNIIVAGCSNTDMRIWKLKPDGTTEMFTYSSGTYSCGYAMTIDSSDNIYITGYISNGTDHDFALWKYNKNGTPASTGSWNSGVITHDYSSSGSDHGKSIIVTSSGKIFISGKSTSTTEEMTIWKFNSDGSLDLSFNSVGYVTSNCGDTSEYYDGYSMTIDSQGNIYTTGDNDYDMVIWKYKSDGTADTTFGTNGYVTLKGASDSTDNEGLCITVDSSDYLFVTGSSEATDNTTDYMTIWKYK